MKIATSVLRWVLSFLIALSLLMTARTLAAQPSVMPGTLSFGAVVVGADATGFVQLRNNTGSALAITQIAAPAAPFSQIFSNCAPLPITLQPLDLCTLEYRFAPTATGPFSASPAVQWQAGPGNSGTVLIQLTGSGVGPVLGISPDPLDFGAVPVGSVAGPLAVTLANTGAGTLDIQQIPTPSVPFFFAGGSCPQPPFSLGAGNSCQLQVEFLPTTVGQATQLLGITSNTTGTQQALDLRGEGIAGTIALSPSLLDFGAIGLGASSSEILDIFNTGQLPLDVFGIDPTTPLLPPFALQFGSCGLPPFVVPPGGLCTLAFSFTPSAVGPVQQQVLLDTNSVGGSALFGLQGSGLDLALQLSPIALDFGTWLVGEISPPQAIRVQNIGSDPIDLVFSIAVLPLNNPFVPQSGSCSDPVTLPPGGDCDLIWRFMPSSAGQFDLVGRVISAAASSPDDWFLTGIALSQIVFADGFE